MWKSHWQRNKFGKIGGLTADINAPECSDSEESTPEQGSTPLSLSYRLLLTLFVFACSGCAQDESLSQPSACSAGT